MLDYGDRDLEIFLASQESAINGAYSEYGSPVESTSSANGGYRPLYSEREANTVRDDTLRATSRNFSRILEVVSLPLTHQQTEDIVYGAQREITGVIRTLVEGQHQHTLELRGVVAFFQVCFDQLQQTVRHEFEQVRADQQLETVAMNLFSERLNIIQRQISAFMRR